MLLKEIWRSRLTMVMGLLLGCVLGVQAQDNKLTIEDITVVPGEENLVAINLTNADPISSLQFDMYLPDGLEFVEESLQKVNDRITKTSHDVRVNKTNYGFIRVAIFSNAVDITSSAIKGNEGAILTFNVQTAAAFKSGEILLTNIVGSNGTTPIPTAVNMEDSKAQVVANAGTYALSCENGFIVSDYEPAMVSFKLQNTIKAVGLQLDVVLPQGISFANNEDGEKMIQLSERASENTRIGMNQLGDGSYRIVISSLTNDVFDATTDELFTFGLIANTIFEGELPLEIKNVKVSDPTGNSFPLIGIEKVAITFGKSKAANDAAYAKLSAEVNALTEALNAANATIAEKCPDVKEQFDGKAIADSIAKVQATIDSLNAEVALTAESQIDNEKAAINAAIEKLLTDAQAAQAAVEADRAKKAANDAAYAKLSAEVNALTEALNAANATIAEKCPDVKEQFDGKAIADSIAKVQATIDSLNAEVALTAESQIDNEKAAINAAIEKLLTDAQAAQAAVEADRAKKAANDAAYAKLSAEVNALTEALNAANATIAEKCPDVKEQFNGTAIADSIAKVQATIDSLNAEVALTAESQIDNEKAAINAAIEKLLTDAQAAQAAVEADRAKKAANDAAYAKLSAEVAELSVSLKTTVSLIAGLFPDVKDDFDGKEIADAITELQTTIDSLYAAIALTDESNIEEEKAAINAAIAKLLADAKAAQATVDAEKAKIAANDEAYKKLSAEVEELQILLDEAIAIIAETCPNVKDNFTGEDIETAIKELRESIDARYEAIELTADSNINEEKAKITKAIEKLIADAEAAESIVSINDVISANNPRIAGIYSINGVKLNRAQKGLNIIVYKDGTVRKVYAK